MRGGLLGLVLLAAFVAFCFTREPGEAAGRARRRIAGDGRSRGPHAAPARAHVHAGDPSVRH